MAYLVLARKYRPTTFAEVAGQEVVTGVLRGAIEEQRVGHAYLFCGPRGTGKTTTARILAKALNCERGPTADPCGECPRCLGAAAGTEVDIVEIDAASHTGVDHIRELRDQAAYAPMLARHKIYIVDEVHMLSKPAFNALLKTLEEPPPHVKFLFATTEPHKLLDTFLSRCQIMRLAPITEQTIVARLEEIVALEGVQPGPGVLEEVARRARGGMRDALSTTDQLLAMAGERPTLEDLARLGGEGGLAEIDRLLTHVEEGRRAELLSALPEREGGEAQLLSAVLDHLRQCLLAGLCGEASPLLEGGETARTILISRARRLGSERLQLWLTELLAARERMRLLAGQERLVLEMALLELARGDVGMPLAELAERLAALESRLEAGGVRAAPAAPVTSAVPVTPAASPRPAAPAAPAASAAATAGAGPRSVQETWKRFLQELEKRAGSLSEALERTGHLAEIGERRAIVRLQRTRDADRRLLAGERSLRACRDALSKVVGRELEVVLEDASRTPPADPFTQSVADLFGGRIEETQ